MGQVFWALWEKDIPNITVTSFRESEWEKDEKVTAINKKLNKSKVASHKNKELASSNLSELSHQKSKLLKSEFHGLSDIITEKDTEMFNCLGEDGKSLNKIDDYKLMKMIGQGSYGTVYVASQKDTGKIYAIKIVKKAQDILEDSKAMHQILAEKMILANWDWRFIIKLESSFQDDHAFYYVLEFAAGGVLIDYIQRLKWFPLIMSKFYAAELLFGIKYLHDHLEVIHRDLKPENILIGKYGHIKLTDFGLSKIDNQWQNFSVWGTWCYFAPEVFNGKGYTKMVDFWAFGCILYEMLTGVPPFFHRNMKTLQQMILQGLFKKKLIADPIALDLISKLLHIIPEKRLGYHGVNEIFAHEFFSSIDLERIKHQSDDAPLKSFINPNKWATEKSARRNSSFDILVPPQLPDNLEKISPTKSKALDPNCLNNNFKLNSNGSLIKRKKSTS